MTDAPSIYPAGSFFENMDTRLRTLEALLGTGAGILPDFSITTPKIVDSAVTTAKLRDGSVRAEKIADATVATVDLASQAVTQAKLAPGSVSYPKLASDVVAASITPAQAKAYVPAVKGLMMPLLIAREEYASGTARTTADQPNGQWTRVNLRTAKWNPTSLVLNSASAINAWTLPAGTYRAQWVVRMGANNRSKTRFIVEGAGTASILSGSIWSNTGFGRTNTDSFPHYADGFARGRCHFSTTGSMRVAVEMIVQTTNFTGNSRPTSTPTFNEVDAELILWKVA